LPSPLPGMDRYLESPAFWPDFHASFIFCWRSALQKQLPKGYEARLGERVYLVERTREQQKKIGPDLSITHSQTAPQAPTRGPSRSAATLEPVTIPVLILEEPRETYIEIIHRSDRSLVAVLELLSPANKEEPGLGGYLQKRNALLRQAVHLVEVDLLIRGRRLALRDPLPAGDYFALVARGDHRPDCQVYSWPLRQELPTIPRPLRAPDPDLFIDLGAVFKAAYDEAGFAEAVVYDAPPPVPLSPEDLAWTQKQTSDRSA
jgi:hypothetical protein